MEFQKDSRKAQNRLETLKSSLSRKDQVKLAEKEQIKRDAKKYEEIIAKTRAML